MSHINPRFLVLTAIGMALVGCERCSCARKQRVPPADQRAAPADCHEPPADAVELARGVRFHVLEPGSGDYRPRKADVVTAALDIWHADGTHLLHSTRLAVPPSGAVGLTGPLRAAAAMAAAMVEGEKRRIWTDTETLGVNAASGMDWPPGDLCAEMQLLSINPDLTAQPAPPLPAELTTIPADTLSTEDGIQYVYLERGSGQVKATADDLVEFVVSGWYLDGHQAGRAFAHDRVIKTRVDGAPGDANRILIHMVAGDHVRVWVPPGLGYKPRRGPADVPIVAELTLLRIF